MRARVAPIVVAWLVAACSGAAATAAPVGPADAVLVGDRLDFQPKRLELPVGRDLLIRFENREKGVAHNLRFKTAPGAPKTKLAKGVVVQELNVRFDQPGEYRYTCDLHPLMTGVAVVA